MPNSLCIDVTTVLCLAKVSLSSITIICLVLDPPPISHDPSKTIRGLPIKPCPVLSDVSKIGVVTDHLKSIDFLPMKRSLLGYLIYGSIYNGIFVNRSEERRVGKE